MINVRKYQNNSPSFPLMFYYHAQIKKAFSLKKRKEKKKVKFLEIMQCQLHIKGLMQKHFEVKIHLDYSTKEGCCIRAQVISFHFFSIR